MATSRAPASTIDLSAPCRDVLRCLGCLAGIDGGGVALLDRHRRIVYYSETYEHWFGPLSENRGKLCHSVFCGSREPCPNCPMEQLAEHPRETPRQSEAQLVTLTGQKRIVRLILFPVVVAGGTVTHVIEVSEDLTEKRRALDELSQRTRRLVTLFKIANCLSDTLHTAQVLSEVARVLRDEPDVAAVCGYVKSDSADRYDLAVCEGLLPGGCDYLRRPEFGRAVLRLTCPNGSCALVHPEDNVISPWPLPEAQTATIMPLKADDEIVGMLLLFSRASDRERQALRWFCQTMSRLLWTWISARRHISQLHSLEKRYRDLFEASADAITVVDRELTILDANTAAQRTGYRMEEILGRKVSDFLPPGADDVLKDLVPRVLAGERIIFEMDEICKDGSRLPEEHSVARFEMDGKEAAIVISRDITDRRKAEQHARRLAKICESIRDGVALVDASHTISMWNRGAQRLLGYSEDEVLGRKIDDLGVDTAIARKIIDEVEAAGGSSGEYQVRKKNGEPVTVLLRVTRLEDEHGNLEGYVGIGTDITEFKRVQQQLFQAQKMESIGTMAGGIAHDFNNILSGILGYASILKTALPKDSDHLADVEHIQQAARRAARLTSQLLGFARRETHRFQPIDLNDVVAETLDMLSHTLRNVTIRHKLHEELWTVDADPTQMEQVLMNLCINARDAMPEGGTLLVETDNIELQPDDLRQGRPAAAPGRYVRMSVSDTGEGMDDETRKHAFEPFFTGKKGGTGLGLATVYGIVTSHKGFVMLYSEPGQGTTVRVYLPVSAEHAPRRRAAAAEAPGGNDLILVVEDDIESQQLMARMLGDMGYRVIIAGSGSEALNTLDDHEIQLVILDMVLPDIPGEEVFQKMWESRPGIRVLLCSGFSKTDAAERAERDGAAGFLAKPFTMAELSSAVHRALAVRAAEAPAP